MKSSIIDSATTIVAAAQTLAETKLSDLTDSEREQWCDFWSTNGLFLAQMFLAMKEAIDLLEPMARANPYCSACLLDTKDDGICPTTGDGEFASACRCENFIDRVVDYAWRRLGFAKGCNKNVENGESQ